MAGRTGAHTGRRTAPGPTGQAKRPEPEVQAALLEGLCSHP